MYYRKRGRERECVRLLEREREHIEQQSMQSMQRTTAADNEADHSRADHNNRPQQQSRAQQNTVKVAATTHSPATQHNTATTMASRKHECSESR